MISWRVRSCHVVGRFQDGLFAMTSTSQQALSWRLYQRFSPPAHGHTPRCMAISTRAASTSSRRSFSSIGMINKGVNIVSAMSPKCVESENIHFDLHKRIPKPLFDKMFNIFNEYKRDRIMEYDGSRRMWKMKLTKLKENDNLAQDLRNRLLGEAGIYLRPFPEEASTFDETVQSVVMDQADSVAITIQNKAFLIIPPTEYYSFRAVNFHVVERIINNDLTGVTHLIKHSFYFPLIGKKQALVHQTYDVWLVAELLQLLKDKAPDITVVLSDSVQRALDQRFSEKQQRRQPIPQVEKVRNPQVPLHPHQLEGVRFFMDNGGCGLLGDEMGLGKTITALAYVASMQKRAFVVAPKKLLEHWACEAISAFGEYFENHVVVLGSHIKKGTDDDLISGISKARLVCVNYELLDRFLPIVKDAKLDTIIVDESHSIKNPEAKRTQLLLASANDFQHKVLLSGTPIKNRVEEFTSQLQFLGLKGVDDLEAIPAGKLWNLLKRITRICGETSKLNYRTCDSKIPKLSKRKMIPIHGVVSSLVWEWSFSMTREIC